MLRGIVCLWLFVGVKSADFSTTTTSYEINLPGSTPIRIVEGEPLWNRPNNFEHRTFTTDKAKGTISGPTAYEDDNPKMANEALVNFLKEYADNIHQQEDIVKEEDVSSDAAKVEKSKSWNLLNIQKHNHPYDDKKGWVSLEPVPWSVSKISKWQSNQKPSVATERPWDDSQTQYGEGSHERPWENHFEFDDVKPTSFYGTPKPSSESNKYEIYYVNKPEVIQKPNYPKPSAVYSQKVHLHDDYQRPKPIKVNSYYKEHFHNQNQNEEDCNKNHDQIMTDGLPANFPTSDQPLRRRGAELHPETHPFNNEGQWVLLSTTKGYKYPKQRQRSMEINPDSIGTHRAVRLTVLPPLKNSKVNMTTSHGGLLQVESTFETVEQARNKFVRKQKQKQKRRPKRKPQKQGLKRPQKVAVKKPQKLVKKQIGSTRATLSKNTNSDSSALLAAVGAGMIPATMAMLMPMAINGRRRRDLHVVGQLFNER